MLERFGKEFKQLLCIDRKNDLLDIFDENQSGCLEEDDQVLLFSAVK